MAEVGVTRDGDDTVVVTVRLPLAAFEPAGLSPVAAEPPQATATSPGVQAGDGQQQTETQEPTGEVGSATGPSGHPDTSPPSDGNNPNPTGRPDGEAKPKARPTSRSRSKASSSRKTAGRSKAK